MVKTSTALTTAFALGATVGITASIVFMRYNKVSTVNRGGGSVDVSQIIMEEMSTSNIARNLRRISRTPHVAGRDVDEKDLVNFISKSWESSGLSVEIHPYEVLLSYPDEKDPNYVAIRTNGGAETYVSSFQEEIFDTAQNNSEIVSPYNAYSPPGQPEGELVYVNFGSIEDFTKLNTTLSIDTRGKICMARYGRIFRANKEQHAALFGCKGLILYTDPKEYTVGGEAVYPETWYLPGSAVQRGSIFKRAGDPLTLSYPSIDTAWRANESDIPLPSIPVTPIGYNDALQYLSKMAGPSAPHDWQGGLDIDYRLGPGFSGKFSTSTMKMNVKNRNERKTINNVIGYIRGSVEPDRYVILGNHRDAWAFGAIDPSSSTAVMLELARVYGVAMAEGWKPRRSIVFCSWGAEEFGLIGSTEWVEEFQKILGTRAVSYINVDAAVAGIYSLYAMATPNLKQLIFDVSKSIPNPDKEEVAAGRNYIYESWIRKLPANPLDPSTEPRILAVGSGSDYAPFIHLAGIPVLDFAYIWDVRLGLDFYPIYHTVYETFDMMTTYLDPDFVYHQAVGRLWGETALRMADSLILPLNCIDYAKTITKAKDTMLQYLGENMEAHGINTSEFTSAVENFKNAAVGFHERIAKLNLKDELAVRAANDQLMQLERAFIDDQGIEGRHQERHVIFSPSRFNSYAGLQFPGLVDSTFAIDQAEDQEKRWDEVKKQFSILLYHLGSAASTLRDFVPIKGKSNI